MFIKLINLILYIFKLRSLIFKNNVIFAAILILDISKLRLPVVKNNIFTVILRNYLH